VPVADVLTLPRATSSRYRKMPSNLRSTGQNRRWHWRCKSNAICRNAISTDIVLLGTKLSTFSGDTFEIFLCWCVGIADLKKQTLIANGLTMKFADDLFAYITVLEAAAQINPCLKRKMLETYRAKPTPRLLFWLSRRMRLD
jgi:hypothetical protein